MGRGIGRVCVAICLGATGACLAGVAAMERAAAGFEDVACEAAVAPEEVAAVLRWARENAGEVGAGAPACTEPGAAPSIAALPGGDLIAVPDNARAGGGKVSAIPGGELSVGHWGRRYVQRVNGFTRALNRSVAPVSSRRSRR